MGNECSACTPCTGEPEFNDKVDRNASVVSSVVGLNRKSHENIKFKNHLKNKAGTDAIVKLQALFRRNEAKKRVAKIKEEMPLTKYFNEEERKETLNNPKFKKDQKKTMEYVYKCSGATYKGEWLGSFRHGKGKMNWMDGASFEGNWDYGFVQGQGTFYHADQDVYEGNWVNSRAHGFGTYTNPNGAIYEGQWEFDLQHGKGKETWIDQSKYEGGYKNGKKEGYGEYLWADGSSYKGTWQDNKINQMGIYTWQDGRKYYGEWRNNNMHGFGYYFWADGRIYYGQYQNDKKEGFGIYLWQDGRKFEGWWSKGKQHGLGKYTEKSGSMRHGMWEMGKRIEWLDDGQIPLINNRKSDYVEYFKDPKSKSFVVPNATFKRPDNFDQQDREVKKQLKVPPILIGQ